MKAFHFAKCHNYQLFTGLVLLFSFSFIVSTAHATALDPITFTPSSQDVGSYAPGSVTASSGSGSGTACVFIFKDGVSISGSGCSGGVVNFPLTTLSALDAGNLITDTLATYTIIVTQVAANSNVSSCNTGNSLTTCENYMVSGSYTYYGEGTFEITSPAPTTQEVSNPQLNIILSFFLFVISFAGMLYSYSIFRMK